ncbi:YhcH/YjgK/YiaL family protein [Thermophilibacter provencensis]|uniref:YhcH/YjgK/YiaL family protein n=1 Tax=Thermophilibacter provencensis TaxID=1852386 RepID=A0ABT7V218_9ACTN|nr:YhcH/YjgK/YiaL family protein [Thermophilibacter provencensis]MDM8270623.1 YhcH/YjgK/YiaL family protein [Thermophilibacter provencensis]
MIFTSLAHAGSNDLSAARFAKALEFLSRPDLADLEPGRHDIMGDEVFANVQELTTVPAGEKNYEAHRRYADIHYVISGTELLGVAPIEECAPVGEFSESDDFGLYTPGAREAWATLVPGDLVVTPPCDAHKPGCCPGEPAPLKKICVKVLVD